MNLEVTLGQILAMVIPTAAVALIAWGFNKWATRMETDNVNTNQNVDDLHDKVDAIDKSIGKNNVETIKLINKETTVIHKRISEVDLKAEKTKDRVDIFHPPGSGE